MNPVLRTIEVGAGYSSYSPDVINLTTTTELQPSSNVGGTGAFTVSVNDGGQSLPLSPSLCQTDPSTGVCSSAIGSSVSFNYVGGETASFAIFVTATANISNNPAVYPIVIRLVDSGGTTHGVTSIAARTE